jgi:hypothetical protein
MLFLLRLDFNTEDGDDIVMYRPTARQRLSKHIPAGASAGKNKTSIAKQRFI